MTPALQIKMSRRGEVNCSNAALTESREARSTLMKATLAPGTVDWTLVIRALARISSRPVK